jgi:MoxR-like ATPase
LVKNIPDQAETIRVPKEEVLEAMSLVVGFDDLKEKIAQKVEDRDRTHFLLEGPPACGKTLIMEGVRVAVKDAYLAFGSRTSGAGLSDVLFNFKPSVLLMDEADKMDKDTRAVLLGVMETGEIIETKSRKTRGVNLNTQVIAA